MKSHFNCLSHVYRFSVWFHRWLESPTPDRLYGLLGKAVRKRFHHNYVVSLSVGSDA